MSYGSLAYGSAAIGGMFSALQTFFAYGLRDAGEYEAQLELATNQLFYSVFIRQASEVAGESFIETRIYTSNDPEETPQLQVVQGDALYAQQIIGAARFITVRVTVINGQYFSVTGFPYAQ